MARRRRRTSHDNTWAPLLVAVVLVLVFVTTYPWISGVVVVVAGAWIYWRRWGRPRRYAAAARRRAALAEQAENARWEATRREWLGVTYEAGVFSVVLSGFGDNWMTEDVADLLCVIPELRDRPVEDVEALVERVVHISPQVVAEGIAQRDAVHLKEALELRGATVRIREVPTQRVSGRAPIPEKVRNEVWRRDGGQCVDCGSRERLEYDHIIAVANGGSNTARNIELRCEPCNRRKGAKV